jgi:leucine dehydrogenase
VTSADVLEILDRLDAAGIEWWLDGGWGADALLGKQTRPHDDVDFAVRAEDIERLLEVFPEFRHVYEDQWPSAYVLRDERGRQLDFHPLAFDEHGNGWQRQADGTSALWPREALAAKGEVAGRDVRCTSPQFQIESHVYEGYDDVDWSAVEALCERFELPKPVGGPPGFVHERRGSLGLIVPTFEELLERWDGEQAVIRRDRDSSAWMFICMHSTRLGPAAGGTRMKVYGTPAEGLEDAMRLSAGMTKKLAVANLGFGGGKAVLAVPSIPIGEERYALLRRYGDVVASLGGSFVTSSDVNTGEADMDVIAERTDRVFGRSLANGGAGDPGPFTATGVFHGIRASLAHVFGSPELSGRSVLVQGAGSVGSALAELVGRAGADVLVADVDADRAQAVASAVGASVVDAEAAIGTECDVYAPCALGATLSMTSVPALRCRIVTGSANNQLAQPEVADLFGPAGILYAPDYVINAGGAIAITFLELQKRPEADVETALARIGDTLREIYERAEAAGITTAAAADAVADARLALASRH